MNFAGRSDPRSIGDANGGAESGWVGCGSFQPNAQAGLGRFVMIKLGGCAVLRHGQVHAPVSIVIAQGGATLFAINFYPALLATDCFKIPVAIALEP